MSDNIKLLVVDDEVPFLRSLTERLQLRGFEVTGVTNGADAIEAARRHDYDVVLLDLKMPGLDGEEVLAQLREKHPLMEVVILTGHGSIDSAVRCTKGGSFSYLQKPCETVVLLQTLEQAYRQRVQRKLNVDHQRLEELLRVATGAGPLTVLRRLKELESKQR